jgi:hypothetical protein
MMLHADTVLEGLKKTTDIWPRLEWGSSRTQGQKFTAKLTL